MVVGLVVVVAVVAVASRQVVAALSAVGAAAQWVGVAALSAVGAAAQLGWWPTWRPTWHVWVAAHQMVVVALVATGKMRRPAMMMQRLSWRKLYGSPKCPRYIDAQKLPHCQ